MLKDVICLDCVIQHIHVFSNAVAKLTLIRLGGGGGGTENQNHDL